MRARVRVSVRVPRRGIVRVIVIVVMMVRLFGAVVAVRVRVRMRVRAGLLRHEGEPALLHAARREQPIGRLLQIVRATAQDDDLEAVSLAEMHVHRRAHLLAELVLRFGETLGELSHVVIVNEGKCAGRGCAFADASSRDLGAGQIAQHLRTRGTALLGDRVERLQERFFHRDAEPNELVLHAGTLPRPPAPRACRGTIWQKRGTQKWTPQLWICDPVDGAARSLGTARIFLALHFPRENCMRKKLWLWGGTLTGVALAATLGATKLARSADHLDAPAVSADPAADINDVYSWVDGSNVVFAMTVYPLAGANDAGTPSFSDQVQYVFHTQSSAAYPQTPGAETNIISQFGTDGKIQLWVGNSEYVTGDASSATGLASADGKVKVFAGLRADPFFFNLAGFRAAVAAVDEQEEAGIVNPSIFNDAGCPNIGAGTATALQNLLSKDPADGGPAQNFFATANTLAIVVSVDKSLVNSGGPIMGVWGSTNQK